MQCFLCEEGQSTLMSEDQITCKCGDVIIIEYHLCDGCGAVWKMADGDLIENSLLSPEAMDDMFIDLPSIFDQDFEENNNFTTLAGYVHKCLDCGIIAYERVKGIYQCPGCGFEWEVIDCG